nr:MAG TPA: hypothetical protein [Caudoviricetes sp.]
MSKDKGFPLSKKDPKDDLYSREARNTEIEKTDLRVRSVFFLVENYWSI